MRSGDGWAIFVKSGFKTEDGCLTLDDYFRAANRSRLSRTEVFEIHEQKVYARREFCAEGVC